MLHHDHDGSSSSPNNLGFPDPARPTGWRPSGPSQRPGEEERRMRDRLTLGPPGTAGEGLGCASAGLELGRGRERGLAPGTHSSTPSFLPTTILSASPAGAEDSQSKPQPQVGAQWGRKQDKQAPPPNPAHIQAGPSSGPLTPLAHPCLQQATLVSHLLSAWTGTRRPAHSPRKPRAHKCSGAERMNRAP